MIWILPGVVLLSCILWGWHNGGLRVGTRLGALLLAYALVYQETGNLAAFISEKGWLTGVLVWPAASGTLFVSGSVMFGIMGSLFMYVAPDEWKMGGKKTGAVLGAALGVVLALMLAWATGVVQDALAHKARQSAASSATDRASATSHAAAKNTVPVKTFQSTPRSALDQALFDFAAKAMAGTVTAALPEQASALAEQMMRSPISVGEGFRQLAENPDLRTLVEDPASHAVLLRGDAHEIQRLPAFRAIVQDQQLMQFLKVAGLNGDSTTALEQDFANKLSTYTRNFERVKMTPEYQALLQDDTFVAKLQSGDWLSLLSDEKIRRMAETLINPPEHLPGDPLPPATYSISAPGDMNWQSSDTSATEVGKHETDTTQTSAPDAPTDKASGVIYRWRDERGRLHITDDKPADGIPYDSLVQ